MILDRVNRLGHRSNFYFKRLQSHKNMYNKMKTMRKLESIALCSFTIVFLIVFLTAQAFAEDLKSSSRVEIVLTAEINWEPLNPARGDKSPQAGTLWGDRNGKEATGFLAKFVDGFSSPPHIHNVTYRAVVISGEIHNDDPSAKKMWMSPGSFWTQPKGEAHITAARGEKNIALVEIDQGPYLVQHSHEAFDSGERPVNIDASNIVWVTPPGLESNEASPKIAYLWGNLKAGDSNGSFVKLPAHFKGYIHSTGSTFRVVIIKGQPHYQSNDSVALMPGSYFSSQGDTMHKLSSTPGKESILYVRTDGPYKVIPRSSNQ